MRWREVARAVTEDDLKMVRGDGEGMDGWMDVSDVGNGLNDVGFGCSMEAKVNVW